MKLLLDQNLSPRLCEDLSGLCPTIVHVRAAGLHAAPDRGVWEYARAHGFIIVTKDADFNQRAFLLGPPPKVVWIQRGNCSTRAIEELLRSHHQDLRTFADDEDAAVLILS